MSNLPVLDYLPPNPPGRATELAIDWLRKVAFIYVGLVLLEIIGMVTDSERAFDPVVLFENAVIFLICASTSVLFFLSAVWLRRRQRRGIWLSLCVVLVNVLLIAVLIGRLFWITFSGKVDPGVPFLDVCAIVFFAGFAVLVLGPMTYYVLRALGEIPTGTLRR